MSEGAPLNDQRSDRAATRQPFETLKSGSSAKRISFTSIGKLIELNSSRKTSMNPPMSDVPPEHTISTGSGKDGVTKKSIYGMNEKDVEIDHLKTTLISLN